MIIARLHFTIYFYRLSGILTARFLLRIRAADRDTNTANKSATEGGSLTSFQFTIQDHPAGLSTMSGGPCGTGVMRSVEGSPADGGSHSTFQRIVESVIDEFGDDPMKRTSEMRMMATNLSEEVTPETLHDDLQISHPV